MKRKRKGHLIPQSSSSAAVDDNMELHGNSSSSSAVRLAFNGGPQHNDADASNTSTIDDDASDDDDRGSSILRTVFEMSPVTSHNHRHSPQNVASTATNHVLRSSSRQQQHLTNGSVHNDDANDVVDRASRNSSNGRSSSRRSVALRSDSLAGRGRNSSPEKIISSHILPHNKSKQKSPPTISSNSAAAAALHATPNGHGNRSSSSTSATVDDGERRLSGGKISSVPTQALHISSSGRRFSPVLRHHHHDAGGIADSVEDDWHAILASAAAANSSASATQNSVQAAASRRSKSPSRFSNSPEHATSTLKRNSTPLSLKSAKLPLSLGEVTSAGSYSVAVANDEPVTASASITADDASVSTRNSSRRRRGGNQQHQLQNDDGLHDSLSRHFQPKNSGKRLRRSSNLDSAAASDAGETDAADSNLHATAPKSFTASLKRASNVENRMQPLTEEAVAVEESTDAEKPSTATATPATARKKKSPLQNKRNRNLKSQKKSTRKNRVANASNSKTVPRAVAALQDYLTPYYSLSSSSEIENDDDEVNTVSGVEKTSTFFDSSADDSSAKNQRRSRRKRKALRRFSVDSRGTTQQQNHHPKPKTIDMEGDMTLQTASSAASTSNQNSQQPRLPRDVVGLSDYLTEFFVPATETRSRKPPRRLEDRNSPPPHDVEAQKSSSPKKSPKKRRKRNVRPEDDLLPPRQVELTAEDFEIYEKFQKILAEADEDVEDESRNRTKSASSVEGNFVDAVWRRKFKISCKLANESIDKVDALPTPPSPTRIARRFSTTENSTGGAVHRPRVRRNQPLSTKSELITTAEDISPCPASIKLGSNVIHCQYQSQYPEEYAKCKRLFICEFCLTYFKTLNIFERHTKPMPTKRSEGSDPGAVCGLSSPPGLEIYRSVDCSYSIFEVCGRQVPTYCTQLCLLAKLFLNHKTVFLDVEPFNFYVMTRNDVKRRNDVGEAEDDDGEGQILQHHFVGYFSKERDNPAGWNVSCIVVLPSLQNLGYGRFLIEFSFLLSRQERKPGSPEKPLSEQGERAYKSFYRHVVAKYCLNRLIPQPIDKEKVVILPNADGNVVRDLQIERHVSFSAGDKSLTLGSADASNAVENANQAKLVEPSGSKKSANAATTPFFTTLNDLQYESGMTLQDIGETLQDLGVFRLDVKSLAGGEKIWKTKLKIKQRKKPKFWIDFSLSKSLQSSWLATMTNIIRRETQAEKSGKRIVLDESRLLWQPRNVVNTHAHHFMPLNDAGQRKSALQMRKPDEVGPQIVDAKAEKVARIKRLKKLHAAAVAAEKEKSPEKKTTKKRRKVEKTEEVQACEGEVVILSPRRTRTRARITQAERQYDDEQSADVKDESLVIDADAEKAAVEAEAAADNEAEPSSVGSSFVPEEDEEAEDDAEEDQSDDEEDAEEAESDDSDANTFSGDGDDDDDADDDDDVIDDDAEEEEEIVGIRSRLNRNKRLPRNVISDDEEIDLVGDDDDGGDDDGSSIVIESDDDEVLDDDDEEQTNDADENESESANSVTAVDESAEPSSVATTTSADDDDEVEAEENDDGVDDAAKSAGDVVGEAAKSKTVAKKRHRRAAAKADSNKRRNLTKSRLEQVAVDDDEDEEAAEEQQQPAPRTSARLSSRKLQINNSVENASVSDYSTPPANVRRSRRRPSTDEKV